MLFCSGTGISKSAGLISLTGLQTYEKHIHLEWLLYMITILNECCHLKSDD